MRKNGWPALPKRLREPGSFGQEKAVRYVELKLGVMSAGNSLRVYRERHRSGMMARASDAFA
ncbi:hypothetical protein, partial [Mesorhizobium sp.]|uniref:hypothetical protein n=1 Tax=Mesorhizobium sp. TaxID=1871066 RepID=UPI000FE622FE